MKTEDYQKEMGEVAYPEGFFEVIASLPVEKQLDFFRTTKRSSYTKTNWSERTTAYTQALQDDSAVQAVILRDGYVVGAMIREWFSKQAEPVLLDRCVCTYYASDNDGAGYNEREDYTYFICVPQEQ